MGLLDMFRGSKEEAPQETSPEEKEALRKSLEKIPLEQSHEPLEGIHPESPQTPRQIELNESLVQLSDMKKELDGLVRGREFLGTLAQGTSLDSETLGGLDEKIVKQKSAIENKKDDIRDLGGQVPEDREEMSEVA